MRGRLRPLALGLALSLLPGVTLAHLVWLYADARAVEPVLVASVQSLPIWAQAYLVIAVLALLGCAVFCISGRRIGRLQDHVRALSERRSEMAR
jgi:hypothetical protein